MGGVFFFLARKDFYLADCLCKNCFFKGNPSQDFFPGKLVSYLLAPIFTTEKTRSGPIEKRSAQIFLTVYTVNN